MRKLALLTAALVAALTMTTVAIAQTDGGYTVTGSTSPAKAKGTKKKPVAIGVNFSLNAPQGDRPATIAKFHVGFENARTNGGKFKTCTAAAINAAGNDNGCTSAARVGTGTVNNFAGATTNQADRSIVCNLTVTLYNAGQGRVAIYLEGNPNGTPSQCAIPVSQALDARWVKAGTGIALEFAVPGNLQNPVPGVSNAIQTLQTSFSKKSTGKGAKKVGYLESIGCKAGERTVEADLDKADGTAIVATDSSPC